MWLDAMAWHWMGARAMNRYWYRPDPVHLPPQHLLNMWPGNPEVLAEHDDVSLNSIFSWIFSWTDIQGFIELLYRGLLEQQLAEIR